MFLRFEKAFCVSKKSRAGWPCGPLFVWRITCLLFFQVWCVCTTPSVQRLPCLLSVVASWEVSAVVGASFELDASMDTASDFDML